MAILFTADLHVGHRNIIRYCNRPFGGVGRHHDGYSVTDADVDEMNLALVERWNDVVHHKDTVYVLGDLALGKLDDSLAIVKMMHGHKILIVGNHDRMFGKVSPGRRERMERKYIEEAGLAGVLHDTQKLMVTDIPVLASHFPYRDEGDSRYVEHRPVDHGKWLLHGHVHDRWKVRAEDRMINVGVDVWDYTPVHEEVLAGIITRGSL